MRGPVKVPGREAERDDAVANQRLEFQFVISDPLVQHQHAQIVAAGVRQPFLVLGVLPRDFPVDVRESPY